MSDLCSECIYNQHENRFLNCNQDLNHCCYLTNRKWMIREAKNQTLKRIVLK